MSLSNAVVDPTKIPLSPMRVNWNGVDLGATEGGVTIGVKYETADIMLDQWGKTPADKKVSGHAFTVKLTLAEIKNKDTVAVALPSAHEITTGTKSIYSDMQIGDSLLAKSHALILHPLEASDADLTEDYKFFKAVCTGATEVKYGPEKQSGMAVEFVVFPDTTTIPARFWIYGDPTIGIVNASAAAAVAGGGNTGNGTVGTITVANGFTKTETITLTVLGVPSGNKSNWEVHGSISGPLGIVQLTGGAGGTGSFVSNPINFIITDGTIDFVIGDTFTIATTAANYA